MTRFNRIGISAAIGILASIAAFYRVSRSRDEPGGDFWQHWAAARVILSHQDPYEVITPSTPRLPGDPATAFGNWYYYPLPAAALGLPFAWLPPVLAAAMFAGVGAAVFAYAVQGVGSLAMCLSAPFAVAVFGAQSPTLLAGAIFVPALQWLLAVKPNIGLALFVFRPSRWAVVGASLACVLAFIVNPHWPVEWLEALRRSPHHHAPISLWYGGPLLLAALVKWRRPEARLLASMACIPQMLLFYDQLPLAFVAQSERERLMFAWLSWAGWIGWLASSAARHGGIADTREAAPWILACLYFPCLLMLLRRPNTAELPAWSTGAKAKPAALS